ncbi:TVP38/TMEM64 family protein [Pararhodobacter sp.]|uniref:TVP38/TMEM64 family protein n=1 Tax=Pararhodobacter sp. TaxID=2127056 RepID=UPI002AFF9A43|nr:VTT domain-containing protein [Pararhodobacter sp.]
MGGLLASRSALGLVLIALWLFAPAVLNAVQRLIERDTIETMVTRAGLWGPILVVGLMTLAVVASPLPSAPIALAAGAAYGHVWGTIQVVIGAELGALIAFSIARLLGRNALTRIFGESANRGLLGSQNALTATIFISRLMPFISFDMMSYAAGLSRLHAWRFAISTLAGIIPASFVLAHAGGEVVSGNSTRAAWAVFGLGLLTGLPLLWLAMRKNTSTKR